MLQKGTIVVFDGYGSLPLYHQGADHEMHPIKPLQDFMTKKDLNEVYIWSDRKDMGPANAFAAGFCTEEYGYNPEHTCYTSNPVDFLDSLCDELDVTNNDIVFIGSDSEMLAYVEIDGDYISIQIPVFLMMHDTITVLDADSIAPKLAESKRLGFDAHGLIANFLYANPENIYIRATSKENIKTFKALAYNTKRVENIAKLHFLITNRNPLEFLDYLKDTLDVPAESIAYVPYEYNKLVAEQHIIKNDTDYMLIFDAYDL